MHLPGKTAGGAYELWVLGKRGLSFDHVDQICCYSLVSYLNIYNTKYTPDVFDVI